VILAIDSSGDELVVAAVEGGALVRGATRSGGRHQLHLLDAIQEVLAERGLAEVDALAVAWGPGSHTGLRTGLSTVAGIAYARHLRAYPISSLAVAAQRAAVEDADVVAAVEAGRGLVYAQRYTASGARRLPAGIRVQMRLEDGAGGGLIDGAAPLVAEPRLLARAADANVGLIAATPGGARRRNRSGGRQRPCPGL
jgi:tRNA threonylcarbamoyl adenosine modification protein YeaZ